MQPNLFQMLNRVSRRQRAFQTMVGLNIDTIVEEDRNRLAEMYIFKGIEELVELRKTFPSVLNKASKHTPNVDMIRVKEEASDTLLFMLNFLMVFHIDFNEILETVDLVQNNNFAKYKEKKMVELNHRILRAPNPQVGIGGGVLSPVFIFVGQNPSIKHKRGDTFYASNQDTSALFLDVVDSMNYRELSYFTNTVKEPTPRNEPPSKDLVEYWKPYLSEEIQILKWDNPHAVLVPIGGVAKKVLNAPGIHHPAYVARGGMDPEDYKAEVQDFLFNGLNAYRSREAADNGSREEDA